MPLLLKAVIALVALGLAVAIAGPAVSGSARTDAVVAQPASTSQVADEAPIADEATSPHGPVDDLEELSPPGPVDDLDTEELSPPGPIDDLGGEVAPVTTSPSSPASPTRAAISLAPPMDPTADVSASPDAGLPLPRVRTQQPQVLDEPDTESHRTPGDGAARLAATPFDAPVAPRVGIKDRVAGAH
jgi:hypothetical protein